MVLARACWRWGDGGTCALTWGVFGLLAGDAAPPEKPSEKAAAADASG